MLVSSTDFFKIYFLKKHLSLIPSMSKSLDPNQANILLGLIWTQTVYIGLSADGSSGQNNVLTLHGCSGGPILYRLIPNKQVG